MSKLLNNTANLQEILETVNSLPNASGGVDLPDLTNPADTNEVFAGKEVIGQDGEVKVGSFTIESELSEQSDIIALIRDAVDNLPEKDEGGGEDDDDDDETVFMHIYHEYPEGDFMIQINGVLCPPNVNTRVPCTDLAFSSIIWFNPNEFVINNISFAYSYWDDDINEEITEWVNVLYNEEWADSWLNFGMFEDYSGEILTLHIEYEE